MAEKKAGGLYMSIGLTLSQLQSDFLAAEQTVKSGIAQLNRQQNIVRLRMEADTAGLDRVKDATKILETQERGLTQLLDLQRDKLKLATAAYQDVAQSKGANSAAAKQLETSMERERVAVARLEAQLKSLSAQKISISTSQLQDNISKLNARIQHVKIQADIDTSKLQAAGSVFDAQKARIAAVTKEIDLQRQKLAQLQAQMYQSAKQNGADSTTTLNIKTNVLQQLQEIQRLKTKLKELQNTNINVQVRAESLRQAEAAISENIARINARIEHIRVKTDIDVSKLGAAASEFDKAKVHVQGLNRELDLQNKKLLELKNALRNSISTNGLNNVKTINLQTEIQKQIQAINQLKAKITELNNIPPPKTNTLLSGYLNIKGDIVGQLNNISAAFSGLKGATASADSAITASLNVIGSIPHPVGRAIAAFAAMPIVLKGVENSILDLTRAATAAGDATYVMSRGMQMSIADAGKFSTNAKIAGTDVNSLRTAVQQVQRQIIRGGDDSRAAEWLKRYGESARNANGDLKKLNEMTFALSRAFHKAQEEGKGAEFVFSVFRNISADDITAIEDWIAVNEQASTIVKAGLANPKLAHEVKGNLNAMSVQSAQLNTSFSNALLPVANEIIPRVTDRLGRMTQLIRDNKDTVTAFGEGIAHVFDFIESGAEKAINATSWLIDLWRENHAVRKTSTDDIVKRYSSDTSVKNARDILEKELARGGYSDKDISLLRSRGNIYHEELEKTQKDWQKVLEDRRKALAEANKPIIEKYKYDDSIKSATDLFNKLTDAEKEAIENTSSAFGSLQERTFYLYQELQKVQKEAAEAAKEVKEFRSVAEDFSTIGQERRDFANDEEQIKQLREARKYYEEAAAIRYKLSHNDYQNKLFEADKWLQDQLPRDAEQSMEKYKAVMESYSARIAQIQKEQLEKTQQYYKDAADIEYRLTHTAFEKQLRDIEQWKEAKIKAGEDAAAVMANAAAKEAEAFESAMDRIRGKLQSLEDKIFAIDHSQYENDLRRIQQEYLREAKELQDLGLFTPERKAQLDYLYNRQKQNLDAKAAKGGDYTKPPEGALQRGGNGIMVIGGDQLIDDGKLNQSIGVLVDDSREFSQLLQGLSKDGRNLAIANRQLAESQRALAQASQQATSGFQLIEGDQFVNQPATSQSPQPQSSYQVIGGDQVVAEVQQFGDAVQQAQNPLQDFRDSTTSAKSALAEAANSFSPDYFKNLADGTKAVSEMQMRLNESTMKLIDAQDKLAAALNSLPTTEDATRRTNQNQSPDGMMKLSYRGGDASRYRRPYSDIPPQQPIAQKSSGFKAGFDWDVFGGAGMTAIAGLETLVAIGTIAPHPALKGLGLLAAGGLALAKGSYDATTEASNQPAQARPFAEADLSGLITPVINIDANVQSIQKAMQDKQPATLAEIFKPEIFSPLSNLDAPISSIPQQLQDAASYQTDSLRELFGTLPNIEANTGDILRTLQERGEVPTTDLRAAVDTPTLPTDTAAVDYLTPLTAIDGKLQSVITELQAKEVTVSFETVVTPLNNIHSVVSNILTAMGNRQPPQINVSPNINVNLGGAYVFDNAMKRELVDDCTQQIVDNVEQTVRQATSNSSYGYGA